MMVDDGSVWNKSLFTEKPGLIKRTSSLKEIVVDSPSPSPLPGKENVSVDCVWVELL